MPDHFKNIGITNPTEIPEADLSYVIVESACKTMKRFFDEAALKLKTEDYGICVDYLLDNTRYSDFQKSYAILADPDSRAQYMTERRLNIGEVHNANVETLMRQQAKRNGYVPVRKGTANRKVLQK